MANMVATVANRGHYRIPHVVKRIHDRDSIDARFYEDHHTKVDARHFDPIVEGMYKAVNEGGTGRIAMVPGLDICGQDRNGAEPARSGSQHLFSLRAPPTTRKSPSRSMSRTAASARRSPRRIASLLTGLYLTDTITRPALVDYVKNMQIAYPYYEKQRKGK